MSISTKKYLVLLLKGNTKWKLKIFKYIIYYTYYIIRRHPMQFLKCSVVASLIIAIIKEAAMPSRICISITEYTALFFGCWRWRWCIP